MVRSPEIMLLAVGQTLIWASIYYIFPALLLRWEQDLGWSKADLTAAIALAVLTSALASPFAGRVIDRGGGPVLMAGSAFAGGLGVAALSMVGELWQFWAIWLVIGLSMSGCLYEPCFALVTRARGQEARRSIIAITLIAGFASTISYPTCYALAEAFGWRQACLIVGSFVILVVVPLLWIGATRLEAGYAGKYRNARTNVGERSFLTRRAFWFLAVAMTFLAIPHGAALHHFLPIADERQLSPQFAILAASLIGPMQVAGRLAMLASERHLSVHGVTLCAFVMMALSIICLSASGTSLAFVSGFVVLFGSAYGTVSILRPLLARDILGEANFGAKSGALALPYLAGSAAAPYLGSILWGWGGYDLMLLTLVGSIFMGCALYLAAHRSGIAQRNA